MGERGPIGKRPDMRHGHRTAAEQAFDEVEPMPVVWPDVPPAPEPEPGRKPWPYDTGWHPIAVNWYSALAASAQSTDYQQSDVATAYVLAEDLSRHLSTFGPMGGNALSAFLSGCSSLLATAGDRRRVKMELARPNPEADTAHSGAVASISAARRRRSS